MRIPEPLRYSLFHFRKRPSLQSILLGGQRPAPLKPVENAYGQGAAQPTAGYSPPVYMSGSPHEYVPEIGPMHVPASDYDPYDGTLPPTRPTGPTELDEIRMAALELSQVGIAGSGAISEDDVIDEDFLAIQMKLASGQSGGSPIISENNNEAARLLLQEHAVNDASEFDRELQAHLFEIQMAVERMRAESFEDVGPEVPNEALYGHEIMMYTPVARELATDAVDYSGHEPQDFFEREIEMIERQFAQPDLSHYDSGPGIDTLFNAADQLAFDSSAGPEPANLEQIIEANDTPAEMMHDDGPGMPGYDSGQMTPDPFGQPMEDTAGGMGPQGIGVKLS